MNSGSITTEGCGNTGTETAETDRFAISVRGVCFSYGEQEVLHNITVDIPQKSLVAAIGPNGGGKTTFLKLLLGVLQPRHGEISVLGISPAKARGRIGFVPQQINFDPDFPITVLEAAMLGRAASRTIGGFSRADRAAALDALRTVGLDGLDNRLFPDLSGGQRQRVLIAQALCSDPEILLLDEPTANVDPETEKALYELFHELNRTKTIIIVSHNLRVVISHATHILCIDRTADMHVVGEDDSTRLEPIKGHSAYSTINDAHPVHMIDKLISDLAKQPCCGELAQLQQHDWRTPK